MWQTQDVQSFTAPDEVQIAPRRHDGTLQSPRTIWIVGIGDRAFIRSTNGPTAAWYTAVVTTGSGKLTTNGTTYDVIFTEADKADLPDIDAAYRHKYGRYASIVDHLQEDGPRTATLELCPA